MMSTRGTGNGSSRCIGVALCMVLACAPALGDWWDNGTPTPDGFRAVGAYDTIQNEGRDDGGDCDWECAQSRWTDWYVDEENGDIWYHNGSNYVHVDGESGQGEVEVSGSVLQLLYTPGVVPTGAAPGTGTYGANGYVWVYCKRPIAQCQPPALKQKIWLLDCNLEGPRGGGPGNGFEGSIHNGDGSEIGRDEYDLTSAAHPLRIPYNDDDDDGDGTRDFEQAGAVAGENDLIPVQVQLSHGVREHGQGTVRLLVDGWQGHEPKPHFKLWKDPNRTTSIELSDDGYSRTYDCATFITDILDGNGGWIFLEAVLPYPYGSYATLTLEYDAGPVPGGIHVSDELRLYIFDANLAIDSDNEDGYGLPDGTEDEDAIEDDPSLPGKYVGLNDDDNDSDGIPDFADGYDLDPNNADDNATVGEDFVQLRVSFSEPVNASAARITFLYDASDPSQVTSAGGIYSPPATGSLRIWLHDGHPGRDGARVDAATPGHFVPSGVALTLSQLDFGVGDSGRTFYVEGIKASEAQGDQRVVVVVEPDGPEGLCVACSDAVRATVVGVDLDIDSDNTNGCEAPDRSAAEDQIEHRVSGSTYPGKFVPVNADDDDGDGIPDFADGFDWDDQQGNDDDANISEDFVQLVLAFPDIIDVDEARVTFTYSASDPSGVTHGGDPPEYLPAASGSLRLWLKDGGEERNKNSIDHAQTPGDYVPSGTFDATDLGLSSETRTLTLYVESVAESSTNADLEKAVAVDPDGDEVGMAAFLADAVRVTSTRYTLSVRRKGTDDYGQTATIAVGCIEADDDHHAEFKLEISPALSGTTDVTITMEGADGYHGDHAPDPQRNAELTIGAQTLEGDGDLGVQLQGSPSQPWGELLSSDVCQDCEISLSVNYVKVASCIVTFSWDHDLAYDWEYDQSYYVDEWSEVAVTMHLTDDDPPVPIRDHELKFYATVAHVGYFDGQDQWQEEDVVLGGTFQGEEVTLAFMELFTKFRDCDNHAGGDIYVTDNTGNDPQTRADGRYAIDHIVTDPTIGGTDYMTLDVEFYAIDNDAYSCEE